MNREFNPDKHVRIEGDEARGMKEGFVNRLAVEEEKGAHIIARTVRLVNGVSLSPQDVLHQEAINMDMPEEMSGVNWSSRESILDALRKIGPSVMEYIPESLQVDFDLILEAVKQDSWAFRYASKDLQADRDFILKAVKRNGRVLQYASEDLQADREIVLVAVKRNGWALQYASKDLQADREIVLVAVKQDSRALQFASEDLWADREIREAAGLS